MKNRILLLAVIFFCAENAHGQFIATINPANTGDPRFIFANPAIPDSGAPFIVVGYQRLFSGLPLLSNSIIGLVLPTARWGSFALVAPGFQSPHFNQSALELRYAYVFDNLRTAIGFNAGTMMTSYNRKKYHLVDAYDPLLLGNQSLNVFNLGLGATVKPIDKLTIGLSADHLNRPRVSFEGGMRRKMHLQAGAMYELGMFKLLAMGEQEEGEAYYSLGGEFWLKNMQVLDGFMVRAFYRSEYLSFGGALRYRNLRFDCLYDLPIGALRTVARGSYQFVMTYNFEKQPCETPPVAYARALQDTLRRWLPDEYAVPSPEGRIAWQTLNSFVSKGKACEILNPLANPFMNYVFFKEHSATPKYLTDRLQALCRFYKKHYAGRGAEIYLFAHINGGKKCTCDGRCEQADSLVSQRINAVRSLLIKHGIPANKIIDKTTEPRFNKCIENELILKSERQRVDIRIVDNNEPILMPLEFAQACESSPYCLFDLSRSDAPYGLKSWLLGIWRVDENGKKAVVWQKRGRGKATDPVAWDWQSSMAAKDPFARWLYYRLRVQDERNCHDVSPVDSIYVKQLIRPTRLLVLYNFDRYTELLGEDQANPEGINSEQQRDESVSHDSDKYAVNAEFKVLPQKSLDALAVLILKHDIYIDKIVGYTDSVGDEDHNRSLSYDRALVVRNYLSKKHGLVFDIGAVQGQGEANPIASNRTPAGRWLNRRVEIVIHYK